MQFVTIGRFNNGASKGFTSVTIISDSRPEQTPSIHQESAVSSEKPGIYQAGKCDFNFYTSLHGHAIFITLLIYFF